MLFSLSLTKDAPRVFSLVNNRGIPMPALLGTTFVALLTFLSSIFGDKIYTFLVSASGLTGFIAWVGIAISHYRYHAKWFPFGPLLALVLCILVILGQDLKSFSNLDWQAISVTYMSVPLFLILYCYYKIKYKTKVIPLDEVDLTPHKVEK